MVKLEWVFLLQLVMGILMLMLLLKMNKIKKQIDGIIMEVKKYVDFVTAGEENFINIEERGTKEEGVKQSSVDSRKKKEEILQNHLIQAVLEEYFP